jgi:hypothetical protein
LARHMTRSPMSQWLHFAVVLPLITPFSTKSVPFSMGIFEEGVQSLKRRSPCVYWDNTLDPSDIWLSGVIYQAAQRWCGRYICLHLTSGQHKLSVERGYIFMEKMCADTFVAHDPDLTLQLQTPTLVIFPTARFMKIDPHK